MSNTIKDSSLPLLLLSLVLGILTFILLKSFFIFIPISCVIVLTIFLFKKLPYKQIFAILMIFVVGFVNAMLTQPFIEKGFSKPGRDVILSGKVINYPVNKDKIASFIIKTNNKNISVKIKNSEKEENKLLNKIEKGSIVKLKGKTDDITKTYPDNSSIKDYLLKIDCSGAITCEEDGLLSVKPTKSTIQILLNSLRNFFLNNLNNASSNKPFNSFLKAIVVGENNIDFYNRERFSELGIAHFLSISGMHFSVLGAFILFLFIILGIKNPLREILVILLLTVFLLMIGFNPPAVRAYIMFSFTLIATLIKRVSEPFLGLCLASIILLLINPWLLKNIGFELSFIGTFALIVAPAKSIYKTIFASFSTIPLVVYNFNILSIASIISNIILLPILPIFYIYGIFVALFGFLNLTFLGKIILILWNFFIFISEKIANIGFSYKYVADISLYSIIIFYSLFILTGLSWFYLKGEKKKLVNQILTIIVIIPMFLSFAPQNSSKYLKIQFIDVGEGDSAFIQTPDGLNILIDGGRGKKEYSSYDYGERVVLPLLKRNGINKLDFVILSHYHDDHYGGLITVLDHIPRVEKLILPGYSSQDKEAFDSLFKKLQKKIKITYICGNRKLKLGSNTEIEFFSPSCDKDLISKFNENSKSITLKLSYKQISILFAGDIEEDAEKWLVKQYGEELDSDILKVAHHGSKTSSTFEFLDVVTPEIAIITCGPPWIFNHPALSVINRLNEEEIDFYTTYEKGDIILYTNGYKYKIY